MRFVFRLIIIMITQTANLNPRTTQIIKEISQSQQFRDYHLHNDRKGIFNIIKCSFDQMISHLINFNKNLSFDNIMQISDFLKDGFKVWAYSQYKIFAWVSAWLLFKRKVKLSQITQQNILEVQILRLFFPQKPQAFLRYQFFLMFTRMNKQKTSWALHEINFLTQYINNLEASSKCKASKIKWRLISFQLFIEKQCLKTPNQCRERWVNHLNPKVKKSDWTLEEDIKMLTIYQEYGSKWSHIAKVLKNRTEHMVKNRFNSMKHKWNSSNLENTPFNCTLILKRLKNRLKSINSAQPKKQKESFQDKTYQVIQNSMIKLKQEEQQMVSEGSEACEVKSQNLTLSLLDVGSWQIDEIKVSHQNEIVIKQQDDYFDYYFQAFSMKPQSNMNVQIDQYKWLDDFMQKKYNQDFLQFIL